MEKIVTYKAFDGRMFKEEGDCYTYEESLKEAFNKVIENVEFYNTNYEKIELMTVEMFYIDTDISYELEEKLEELIRNIFIIKINKDSFEYCREELNAWFERTEYVMPISEEQSKYDFYIYNDNDYNNAFTPIDNKVEEASSIIRLVLKGNLL